jgi:putative tricarboxylic transport membrane protein
MKRIHLYCNLFWLLFSLVLCIEAYGLNIGAIRNPGPGFFPFCVGLVMAGLSLIAIIQSVGKYEPEEKSDRQERFRWWNIAIILAAILVYALVLQTLGFLICTFLFVSLLLKVVEPQSWKATILGGLITAVSSDIVFNLILQSQIPSGIFGF